MAKSLNSTTDEYLDPVGINQEHDKLILEPSQEEEIKSELNKKMNAASKENGINKKAKTSNNRIRPDETNKIQIINQSQLINKNATQSNSIRTSRQNELNQKVYLPIDKLNYLKLNRLQQQYLNSCACNNCELCNKQTRAIQSLHRELEMARCELRSLRHYLLLSNSSKQPLNCLTYNDEECIGKTKAIPPPTRYACSVPNTPKHRFDGCYDQQCQNCYFVDPYQSNSIHNIPSPCGLEYLLPNVNNCSYSGCCLEYTDQSYDLHQDAKKAYEQKKPYDLKASNATAETEIPNMMRNRKALSNNKLDSEESLIGNQSSNIQLESRSNKNKTILAAMQTFTLDQDDYSLTKLEPDQSKQMDEPNNNYFNENSSTNVKTNIKTQQNTNALFNRSKTSKSLNRSLSRDQQFGSLNYSKSESFDEINFHQNRDQNVPTTKQSQGATNYETTC